MKESFLVPTILLFFMASLREASNVEEIQKDWENREFAEVVKLNILQVVQFLNNFDTSARCKLSRVNEKLHTLERLLEFCESSVRSSHLESVESSSKKQNED